MPLGRGSSRGRRARKIARLGLVYLVVLLVWTEAWSFALTPAAPGRSAQRRYTLTIDPTRAAIPITFATVAPAPTPAPAPRKRASRSNRIALLVGINEAPGAPPAPGSRADAFTMRTALLQYGFHRRDITMLLDADATRTNILRSLNDLAARSSPSDTVVVSITTHSSPARSDPSFAVWDGRISASELAGRLNAVRGRLWTMLTMCYAGAYARPGIVGSDRVAIFSSSANERSWQYGGWGSVAVLYIVRYGMIDGHAPGSVEASFRYARQRMQDQGRRVLPIMSDGVDGDLVLGPVHQTPRPEAVRGTVPTTPAPTTPVPTTASPSPTATPTPHRTVPDASNVVDLLPG